MVKAPLDIFMASLDLFVKTMRDFQVVFNETADSLTADVFADDEGAQDWFGLTNGGGDAGFPPGQADVGREVQSDSRRETRMADIDLGGDDVKNVSYWISFVKPDFVATLQTMKDETIDYATNEGSFGGLKIGEFFENLAQGNIPMPKEWTKLPTTEYKLHPSGYLKAIPDRDRKYIRFNLKLNWRQPLPDAERERDKVEVLREIRDRL
jgi:hypothetical protein